MSTEKVSSAVFSSMAEAEQYFVRQLHRALDRGAGQVAAGHGEGEVDAGEDLGIGVGAFGLELDAAAAHSVPAALEDQDHVGGAAARAGQQHFHGRGARLWPPPSTAPSITATWPLPVLAVKSMPEGPPQSIVHSMCVCP